jgi:ABC-type cobalt transport system substrate-binding protein
MSMKIKSTLMIAILIGLAMTACQNAQEEYASVDDPSFEDIQSKFNTQIPEEILTPDHVDTRIGPLEPWFEKTWQPGEIVLAGN